jgi:hypothetical protein
MQEPTINFATPSILVIDSEDPARGPAHFFQSSYDAVVILPESPGFTTRRALRSRQSGGTPIINASLSLNLTDSQLDEYPKVMKIKSSVEEGAPNPYCQQMKVLEDGSVVPVVSSTQGKEEFSFHVSNDTDSSCWCEWLKS